jgi:hypothetical protein
MNNSTNDKLRIMVYGIDSLKYQIPEKPIENSQYILIFEKLDTGKDLSEYDGGIFFANTFEIRDGIGVSCSNKGYLLKRMKQVHKLIDKGGFVCILFYSFQDKYSIEIYDYNSDDTSIGKVLLNDLGLGKYYRKSISAPIKFFKIFRDEFKSYLSDYGVAKAYFTLPLGIERFVKPICNSKSGNVGFVIYNSIFILPCLAVDKDEKNTIKLFTTVAKTLANTLPKLVQEIPSWIDNNFIFPNEKKLLAELKKQEEILSGIKSEISIYKRYKGCLAFGHDSLVDSVACVLERFLGLKVTKIEEFKEDLKLFVLPNEELIAIAEVKGVNSGIKRDHINQVDSHRERLELSPSFPAILIVNAKMNIASLEGKNIEKITKDEILEIFKNKKGWLKVAEESYEIKKS